MLNGLQLYAGDYYSLNNENNLQEGRVLKLALAARGEVILPRMLGT